jgi:predicted XRE-type DNA-binding protein
MGERFDSIWDALEDTPEQAENMKLRAVLLTAIKDQISKRQLTQAEAAKLFGVTQPRISDLIRGKFYVFGLDNLVNMTVAAGLHVELRVLETI